MTGLDCEAEGASTDVFGGVVGAWDPYRLELLWASILGA
jgi:hypothetical protein